MSFYERITPFKTKVPYWLFWFTIGLSVFVAGEAVLVSAGEDRFLLQALFGAVSIAGWPTMFIWMSRRFQSVMERLSFLMWKDPNEFQQWLQQRTRRIFSFGRVYPIITSLIFGLGVPLTLVYLGIPVRNELARYLGLAGLGFICFIGGHYAYVFIDLMVTLRDISERPIQAPFFRVPNPAITDLQGFYSAVIAFIVVAYSSLVVAVWQSPYGLNSYLLIWLSVLGMYPLAMFVWTIYKTHGIVKKIKYTHVDIVNEQIQKILSDAIENGDATKYEQLDNAMSIQNKVQDTKEWPVSYTETFTFLLTMTATILQLLLSLTSVFSGRP